MDSQCLNFRFTFRYKDTSSSSSIYLLTSVLTFWWFCSFICLLKCLAGKQIISSSEDLRCCCVSQEEDEGHSFIQAHHPTMSWICKHRYRPWTVDGWEDEYLAGLMGGPITNNWIDRKKQTKRTGKKINEKN